MASNDIPNFVDTDPPPKLLHVMDEFAQRNPNYREALLDLRGALRDLRSNNGTGQIVNAHDFGITNDGANSEAGFQALGNYLRAHDGTTVLFLAGLHVYTNNSWLRGTRNVHILGSGTQFRCDHPWGDGDIQQVALLTGGDYFLEGPGSPGAAVEQPRHKFATAAYGDTALTLLLAGAAAANYQAGDLVFIYGYKGFHGGWPPMPRYHEIVKVASVDAANNRLNLYRPLRNSYDSRWYDDGAYVGAPRCIRLSRRSYFTLGEYIHVEGIEFVKGPNQPSYFGARDLAPFNAQGALRIIVERCKMSYTFPTVAMDVRFIDCDIDRAEVDKCIETVRFDNCRVGEITGGVGVETMSLRECLVTEKLATIANVLALDNCDIYVREVVTGSVIGNGARIAYLGRSRFHRSLEDTSGVPYFTAGGVAQRLPAAVAVDATHIRVPLNAGTELPQVDLRIGDFLFTQLAGPGHDNHGTISAIYQDGSNIAIEANFRKAPQVGDVFSWKTQQYLFVRDCVETNGSLHRTLPQGAFEFRPQNYYNSLEQEVRHTRTVAFPEQAVETMEIDLGGYLEKITFNVLEGSVGASLFFWTNGTGYQTFTVNGATAGMRTVDHFDVKGAQAGDALSALLPANANGARLFLQFHTPSSGVFPKGYLTVEVANVFPTPADAY